MEKQVRLGILYSALSYIIWGILPIYWKWMDGVPAWEILAHRIVWSFIFMIFIVFITGNWNVFIKESKTLMKDRKKLFSITLASVLISLNWLTFIWAVNSNHVLQASLGYYINPLISILLGMIVLKEKSTWRQNISFILAGIGVLYLTISFGVIPWVSLILAITFAFYGLLKKTVQLSSMFGLTIETLLVTPFALIFLAFLPEHSFQISNGFSTTNLLLIGAGVATAVPLLLFGSGTKNIPLSMVGFLQYIAPTLMLISGVFLYNEAFTLSHFIAFLFIWSALIIYMGATYKRPMRQRHV
ncbi:EamA family transporter RarD [Oceanobacillus piezotolerans]|uniref:EamA family transporter RarD n=1 Tax=Oceanobacillus piezotolerans TaxID=2448030 RepID=A0A498DBG7_9BACI|nr:EamA family transporter RarD [Oceanobacillus piezotolerans]RLL42817.1 EamA family transporter RarD [Oceanobacillus piezotolerans]